MMTDIFIGADMRLEEQIRRLEQQKVDEIAAIKVHVATAKRQMKEKLSPRYIIRKHTGAAITAALLAGYLLVPRSDKRERSGRTTIKGWMKKLFGQWINRKAAPAPSGEKTQKESHSAPSLLGVLLGQVFTLIINRIDWVALLNHYLASSKSRTEQASGSETSNEQTCQA